MSQVTTITKNFREFVGRRTATLGQNVTRALIAQTPVDTGWAAAQWIPGIGSQPRANPQPNTRNGKLAVIGAAKARQSRETARLGRFKLIQGNLFITNFAPYIQALNSGTVPPASPQNTVPGWIQATIAQQVAAANSGATRGTFSV